MKNLSLSNASSRTKIRHRNDINQTLVNMSLPARRILFLAMSQINTRHSFGEDIEFEITAADYANLCGTELNTAYEQMNSATEDLQKTLIKIDFNNLLPLIPRHGESIKEPPRHKKGQRGFHITEHVDYLPGEGKVVLIFSRTVEPYIAMLTGDFTTQGLVSALRFTDKNTAAMYQLIRKMFSQPKTKEWFVIELDELKYELGLYTAISNSEIRYAYPQYKEFNRTVLTKCLKKINEESEMTVNCSVAERKGRAVKSLLFDYTEKDQFEIQF